MSEATPAGTGAGTIANTWRRVAAAIALTLGLALAMLKLCRSAPSAFFLRTIVIGVSSTVAFLVVEVVPPKLPRWFQRWVLQVGAVGASVAITIFVMYRLSARRPPSFLGSHDWMLLTLTAILFAPWTALAAVVRQKEAFVRDRELAFALERSELEREALDARLHLLQAQVAPHFLFNTLANVQALVDAGSPQASALLRSLTAYLRAAVPQLHESAATIERELQLVRPYLELMQMRMPDRLRYAMNVDPLVLQVRCPPTTVLTLVENAVRHGIDPSEEGGRIDIDITRIGERCVIRVTDTGAGLQHPATGLGIGLTALRERLQLIYGDAALVRLTSNEPRGAIVEVDMPGQI